jgi:hypothetical protein
LHVLILSVCNAASIKAYNNTFFKAGCIEANMITDLKIDFQMTKFDEGIIGCHYV